MAGPIQAALHIGVPEYAVGIGVREGRGGISRARAAGNDHGAVCHFLLPMSKVSPSVKFPASASSSSILASSSLASLIAPSSSSSSLLKVVFVSAGYGGHSEDGCCIWSNFGMGRGRWREEGRRSCRRTSYDHLLARRYGRESLRFPPLLTGLFSGRRAARGIRNMPRQRRPVAVSSDNTVPNLDDVEHLRDWLGDIQEYENPIKTNPVFHPVKDFFIGPKAVVAKQACLDFDSPTEVTYFRQAGPREKVVFQPDEVRAAIVTCGGLCPGLNTVIREIVCGLWYQYGVREVMGIKGGYRGFYSFNTIGLTPKHVDDWHKRGGTMLGTTRGGHDTGKIVDSIQDRGINQVYIIGGDGTQRGAVKIHKECVRRGLKVAVAGIPKTVDNDVAIIDKSFGFDTAVEAAQDAISAAHVEVTSTPKAVGVVKVMGRYAGHIAVAATLGSRDVDCCLIPEIPFFIDGEGGLFQFLEARLRENDHCVILVAEGAGQDLMRETFGNKENTDQSGNKSLLDVGLWLSSQLKEKWRKEKGESLSLKYIDPTYMVRAVPSNASDTVYCTMLAHNAIHGVMTGFTGFITGPVNSKYCYIPMERVTDTQNFVNVQDRIWSWVQATNNQPEFSRRSHATKGVPSSEPKKGGQGKAK